MASRYKIHPAGAVPWLVILVNDLLDLLDGRLYKTGDSRYVSP